MKRFSVLLLVLVAVFAIHSVVFAEEILDPMGKGGGQKRPLNEMYNPPHGLGSERLTGTITVKGDVGPYAAIFIKDKKLSLNWTGYEKEVEEAAAFFDIKANTKVGLKVQFGALSQGYNRINTAVKVEKMVGNEWKRLLDGSQERWGTTTLSNDNVQGQEHGRYKLTVTGTLGDIHDQPEGNYNTTITLTVYKS